MTKIAIVNQDDEIVGAEERELAWEKGLIVRLVRIFIINNQGELYLQRRSGARKIKPNTWDQSAGGHVDAGEDYDSAAHRETLEELGLKGLKLINLGKFYTEKVINAQLHKQFNMLYKAKFSGLIKLDPTEVSQGRWISLNNLAIEISENPDNFTEGLKEFYTKIIQ